jgi:hypothetical protein
MKDITAEAPGKARRVVGFGCGTAGTLGLIAVAVLFGRHPVWLGDILALVLAGSGLAVALTLVAMGLFLSGASVVVRRIGCVTAAVFGIPSFLAVFFLIWSLFQTTAAAPR